MGAEPEKTNSRNTSWEAHVSVFDCDFIRGDQLWFRPSRSDPANLCSLWHRAKTVREAEGSLAFSDSAALCESCLV